MPSQRSFQKPSPQSSPRGVGPSAFISERGEAGTIPIPGGIREREEDGFLLVFVVLISECISPRAGGGCGAAQGMLSTQEPVRL